ncbi:MAG: deoxyribose-phosphate aldolase [Gammaproteobacteria bacterium]|nr:deoxyribose-phosphate aldolase [Gammaproteobacteria bacterium]
MSFPNKDFEAALIAVEKPVSLSSAAKQILPLIDLTSLNADDTDEKILKLCEQAQTPHGNVAAVCIYPKFVALAKEALKNTNIKIATVVNFPSGDFPINDVTTEIKYAIQYGADEIDVVFPYKNFLRDKGSEIESSKVFIKTCKMACGKNIHLKVILESGAFPYIETLYEASNLVVEAGADFLKTSTGKIEIGATLEAAAAMILAIKNSKKPVGFKASGGVREVEKAYRYISLASHVMGKNWVSPKTFRFGASSLLKDVLMSL